MIIGKNINLRKIEVSDAEFVLSLRLDPSLNKYLSPVENDLDQQRTWIEKCKNDLNQWYFIVQNKKSDPVGTIRIYDIKDDHFCWGSWIIKPSARHYATFESIVLLYEFAFFDLGFNYTKFDVRKKNTVALNFYLRFGASIISEDEDNFFLIFTKEDFMQKRAENSYIIDNISKELLKNISDH